MRKTIREKRILLTICSGIFLLLSIALYLKAINCYTGAARDCEQAAIEFCELVCWDDGDCDRVEFVNGNCVYGYICNQLFDIYCNNGYWGERWESGCNAWCPFK